MKQLLIDSRPLQISPSSLQEGIKKTGNVMIEGILATAEIKNGNGRYYKRELWEREIDKYIEESITKNNALGELDHPSCFVEGYKIMTLEKGWVYFNELDGTEHAATLNPITQKLEYQLINKVINQPYKGDIINIESKTFQASVTPNHRFIITNQHNINNNRPLKFKLASELNKGDLIPKLSEYEKVCDDIITIENEHGIINIPSNIFSKFMGWYLAEGSLSTNKKYQVYGVNISQNKEENFNELKIIFDELSNSINCKYSIYKRKKENNYYIGNKILYTYLKKFGLSSEKYIPKEIKSLSKENILLFLESYLKADGTKQYNQEVYYTSSHQMALDISELINLSGYMSSISSKEMFHEKYLIEGKWIKDFDWYTKKDIYQNKTIEARKKHYTGKTLYSIRRKYSKYYHISDCNITTTQYDGNIYCVSVPNETILVMSPNGSSFWSGNSQIINLKNVSHVIKKIWWDGDNIMGKIEILPTHSGNIARALVESGVTIGISSRGMGSLKQNGDILEVDDDFSLLCWDLVSTPSNPNSWMKESKGLNESLNYSNYNPYQKVNTIITDILCSKGNCPIF